MTPKDLQVGEVVQINPETQDLFGGCFMVVTEPKSFGAQGYVTVPHADGPRQAYFRCKFEDMETLDVTAEWRLADD